jgi:hypothetical protein
VAAVTSAFELRHDGVLLRGPTGNTLWTFDMPDGRGLAQTPLREWSTAHRVPIAQTIDHSVLSWHPRGCEPVLAGDFRAPTARLGSSSVDLDA